MISGKRTSRCWLIRSVRATIRLRWLSQLRDRVIGRVIVEDRCFVNFLSSGGTSSKIGARLATYQVLSRRAIDCREFQL